MLEAHPDWKPSLLMSQREVRQDEEHQETPHTVEAVLKCVKGDKKKKKQQETGLLRPVEENILDRCAQQQITRLKGELMKLTLTELFLKGEKKGKISH